ncbi:SPFH domain-containing protein [Streptomyces sp. TBY4]|uniref:SPFH domain-containing protein n=1 Tax=Streptomyces sp. TBY4 TaxID=2962030 RepID=UPI0020B8387F|nr:SPFH domain-containing protein [Streptomyces sp. TBY4]MCP3756202.1 SPFH domain-containing protein [Streptomyces sp. TBY4]
MYPTRTTSTTGTFEIPPHPTPRPATVAGAHPEPAPAAAGWEASGAAPDQGAQPSPAHPSATPDHTEPYGAPPAPSAASTPGPGQAGAGADQEQTPHAEPTRVTPDWTPAGAAPAPAGPDRAAPVAAAATPTAAGAGAEPTPAEAGRVPAGTTAEWAAPERTVPDRAAPVAAAAAPTAAGTAAERAEPAPAAAGWVPAGTDTERAVPERAVLERGEPALAVAMPVGAGLAGARAAADGDVHLSAGPDRAGPVPVGAVPTAAGAERDAHWSAVPDRGEQALAAAVPVGAGTAGAGANAERDAHLLVVADRGEQALAAAVPVGAGLAGDVADGGVHLSVAPDRAEPVPAGAVRVGAGTAEAVAERDAHLLAVPEPVGAGWTGFSEAAGAEVSSVSAAPPAAAGTGWWAGPIGWAPAAEPAGPVREEAGSAGPVRGEAGSAGPVRGEVRAAGPARDGVAAAVPAGGGRDADGLVAVGAVAQAGRGGEGARSDVPAARAQAEPPVETLRLRTPGAETARPHPQDEVWPPAAPRGPRHAGPPAAWDLPGQGGSSPEQGRAPQHAVPAPAPEAGSADPAPVRDLPEQEEAARELTWSVPAPAPGGIVPGPGIADGAEVAEVVARAVARIGEDDTQDLPRVAPARGVAVTEVPVHLPFRGAAQPQPKRQQTQEQPKPKAEPRPKPRSAPGRRVPRGDDRLHEHHGPVLPGWIAVTVGGIALAGCAVVLWRAGAVPDSLAAAFGAEPRPYRGLQARFWPPLAFLGVVTLLALGGLGRGRAGHAWVLTLFGRYRGTVRRTGLTWISPLLLRRRVDVRLRHWRSDPMPAVDSGGLALQVVVQVVWQVKDTARATLAVEDHVDYLAEQVESAMARVLSQLPADAFHEDAPTLRDAEAVGDALTRMLAAETEAVGVEVFSAQPTRIEYAPEVADAMRRRRVAAIDAKHRDTVLTSVVDAVDDTVHRLTSRGIVELDDYERKALVKDLTVAFYTGRSE